MPYFSNDTIAQIGTPAGKAGVGAIRLSGDETWSILARTTQGLDNILGAPTRCALPCRFLIELPSPDDRRRARAPLTCPARVFIMPAPASYTREHIAELHLPGSPALLRAALATLVRNGARPAAPGEFTFRAFRNGRLTLGQAEAVEAVVRAGDAGERRRALSRLGDANAGRVRAWRDRLMDIAAGIEAVLDFSEEELQGDAAAGLAAVAGELTVAGTGIAAAGGDASPDVPHVALVGLVNAGKSSLVNALLGRDAAIVSSQASTTRDSLRHDVLWNGVRFVLSDNPGFDPWGTDSGGRAAARAMDGIGGEDLACWVLDGSRPLDDDDGAFISRLAGPALAVVNKCDLPRATLPGDVVAFAADHNVAVLRCVEVSAVAGTGLAELRDRLAAAAANLDAASAWSRREMLELTAAAECCRLAAAELAGPGRLELAAEDLRRGVSAFSRMLGDGYAEEALGRIFSRFCIGK